MAFRGILYHVFLSAVICILLSSSVSYAQQTDSAEIAIAPRYDKVSKLHRILFGENYRKEWAIPVKLRVVHLSKEKGGLTVIREGGGLQTRSLRLQDATGQEWVLRSAQKYPERQLPPRLKETVARDILQDQVTTANPFAAMTVPPLAAALGIPHSNPEIVVVAPDTALGKYNEEFAGRPFLFEEREPLESTKTDNTEKAQEKLKEDNDVSVNQQIVLRARLLDMLLGDWDRHEDQWRWDRKKTGKETEYTPVPRDRDQVYYKTSGIFPWIVSHQWLKSKFQPYKEEIRDIKGWNFNARYFDRYFLNSLGEQDWQEQISYVQKHLTDQVITDAVKRMPPQIYNVSGEEIVRKLIARRNNLQQQAIAYYKFISIYVDVPASDKRERFEISGDNGWLNVTIYKLKKDTTRDDIIYQRNFDPHVTKEVRLYGFDGKDEFHVKGPLTSSVKVRMIGGGGSDVFHIDSTVNNKRRLYVYDRSGKDNILPSRSQARIRTGKDSTVNAFNPKGFQYDRFEPITLLHYNNDYGVSLVGGFAYTKHGFRKEPHAFRHQLLVDYSIVRKSFIFTYTGDIKKVIGDYDLNINLMSRGPNNVSNFFGIGNESNFVNEGDKRIGYYRNRYDYILGDVRLSHAYGQFTISAGVGGQFYTSKASNNDNKYLHEFNEQAPEEEIYLTKWFAGLVGGAELDTRINKTFPSQGVYWHTTVNAMQQVSNGSRKYGQILSEFSFYYNPDKHGVVIIANRTGAGTTVGDPAYFQLLKLGGPQTLRGYHTWRFSGKTMLYNNFELRLKLLDFNSYLLPGSIGVIGLDDVGRVWMPGETSSKWHNGYGAGIYIIPNELILLQVSKGYSEEGSINYLTIGYRF
ncbi:BamA/TamA family outer membrane protein [Chitinophaga tropicalis]|uniref:Bacterial surface antigen (D15) domain-containing protein n=1 Tax=Chitinophaga tropicalis TaxID=2683588 RepID=A0A7K1UEX7_9BACT|nr:hypothetical protein [Chitinophaga tropicalis]MVT12535.1 hypothetical protein [Chitinophaga tropicalis]